MRRLASVALAPASPFVPPRELLVKLRREYVHLSGKGEWSTPLPPPPNNLSRPSHLEALSEGGLIIRALGGRLLRGWRGGFRRAWAYWGGPVGEGPLGRACHLVAHEALEVEVDEVVVQELPGPQPIHIPHRQRHLTRGSDMPIG